jgi:hypothetical protein
MLFTILSNWVELEGKKKKNKNKLINSGVTDSFQTWLLHKTEGLLSLQL